LSSQHQLLSLLGDFHNVASRMTPFETGGVQAWRFTFNDVEHVLHFHTVKGSAAKEFAALKRFQDLSLPAPRVIALLSGFIIDGRRGDATILTSLSTATRLDTINPYNLSTSQNASIRSQLVDLLKACHRHQCCPRPLTLSRFALKQDGSLIVLPGNTFPAGFVSTLRLGELASSALFATTRAQRLRIWNTFREGERVPADRLLFARAATNHAGRAIEIGGQSGTIRTAVFPGSWWSKFAITPSAASDLRAIEHELHADSNTPTSTTIKSDSSGTVRLIHIGGVEVVVKSPLTRPGLKTAIARFRTSRVRRVWKKAHTLLARGFAVEMPLFVLDPAPGNPGKPGVIAFEKVPGTVLTLLDFDLLSIQSREMLFVRIGTFIRRIEAQRWSHFDTKSSNWIISTSITGELIPVMIDCDGVRFYPWRGFAIRRLLRSLDEHPKFKPIDRKQVWFGYNHSSGQSPAGSA